MTLQVMFVHFAQIGNTNIPDQIICKGRFTFYFIALPKPSLLVEAISKLKLLDTYEYIMSTKIKMIQNFETYFHNDLKVQIGVAAGEAAPARPPPLSIEYGILGFSKAIAQAPF